MRSFLKVPVVVGAIGIAALGASAAVHATPGSEKTTVVLVHGAFADGSSWKHIIPRLQAKGLNVVSVQNPLTSLADDVAATRRVLDMQTGPVVLVGHSWGGIVITEVGNHERVKSLVYVAAFAPDADENLQALLQQYPSKIGGALVPDAAGFLYIDRSQFKEVFAADVSERVLSVMSATQKPINSQTFGQAYETPAWRDTPGLPR